MDSWFNVTIRKHFFTACILMLLCTFVPSFTSAQSQNNGLNTGLNQVTTPSSSFFDFASNLSFEKIISPFKNSFNFVVDKTANFIQPIFTISVSNVDNSGTTNGTNNQQSSKTVESKTNQKNLFNSTSSSLTVTKNYLLQIGAGLEQGSSSNVNNGSQETSSKSYFATLQKDTADIAKAVASSNNVTAQNSSNSNAVIKNILTRVSNLESTPRVVQIINTYPQNNIVSSGGGISVEAFNALSTSVSRALDSFNRNIVTPSIASAVNNFNTNVIGDVFSTSTTRGVFSNTATGLTYDNSTGVTSLTSGYVIPLTASTTEWASTVASIASLNASTTNLSTFYQTPSTRITAGTGLAWSGNTINSTGVTSIGGFTGAVATSSFSTSDFTEGSNLYFTNGRADARANIQIGLATSTIQAMTANSVATSTIRNMFSNTVTGLTFNSGTGITSLTSGYNIPLTASTTEWANKVSSQWTTSGANISYVSGNVGIGTTGPQGKLDVAGQTLIGNGDRTAQSSYPLYISDSSNLGWKVADGSGISKFELYAGFGGTNEMRLLNGVSLIGYGQNLTLGTSQNGSAITILDNASGNVGIGTTTPETKLSVVGAANFTGNVTASAFYGDGSNLTGITSFSTTTTRNVFSNTVTGLTYSTSTGITSLTSGYNIPLTASTTEWANKVSSQWTTSGANISYTAGNVGIGTSTPSSKLTVAGDINFTGALRANGDAGTAGYVLLSNGASAPTWVATSTLGISSGSSLTGTTGQFAYFSGTNTAVGTSTLFLSNGNIGIGTTTPATALSVVGAGNFTSDLTTRGVLNILGTGTSTVNSDILLSGDIVPSADNTYRLGTPSRMWKDVYIGPGSLYVNGQKVLQTDVSNNVTITADSNQNLVLKSAGTGDLELNPSGTGQILLKGNLRLSAGKTITTSDASPLVLTNGADLGSIRVTSNTISPTNLNGGITIAATGTGGVYFTQGNVGIATTSPAYPLTVSGDINFTGALRANGNPGTTGMVLLSNGSSAPTWVATSSLGIGSSQWTTSGSDISFATGYVGIGTTTPANALTVIGNGHITSSLSVGGAAATTTGSRTLVSNGTISAYSGSEASARLRLGVSGITNGVSGIVFDSTISGFTTAGGGIGQPSAQTLAVYTGNGSALTERARFDGSGNFGIGTTTPSARLAITGNAGTGDIFNIASSTNASLFKIGATGATYFNNDAGTTGMVLLSNGVGSSPTWVATSSLGISGGGGSSQWTTSGSDIYYTTGKVSIGTSTQSTAALTVSGSLSVSSSTNGSVIIGAVNGNSRGSLSLDIQSQHVTTDKVASGIESVAVGLNNLTSGQYGVTVGRYNTVTGTYGAALGTDNSAWQYSASVGTQNTVSSQSAVAVGRLNNVSADAGAAYGMQNTVSGGGYSLAMGYGNTVTAGSATAIGNSITNTIATTVMIGPNDASKITVASAGLGLGTTTPSAKLDIYGTAGSSDVFSISSSTNARLFTVGANGYVGVGTRSPTAKLDIYQGNIIFSDGAYDATISGGTLTSGTALTAGDLTIKAGSATAGAAMKGGDLILSGGDGYSGNAEQAGNVKIYAGGNTYNGAIDNYIGFFAGAAERMRILSSGNIGIGTTTSGSKLTVAGDINFTGALRANGDAGTTGMVLLSNGTGASPTWVATSTLGISGGGGGTINSGTAGQIAVYNSSGTTLSGTSTLYISNGNIGIGTTTPASALSVVGNALVSGGITTTSLVATSSITVNGLIIKSPATGGLTIGASTGASTGNTYSTFIGDSAGVSVTGATYSNFLGASAGTGATSASYSNFIGYDAGDSAAGSTYSNFMGYRAGYGATNATESNFFGFFAGVSATGAAHSNFFGESSGQSATNASYSNFFGDGSGQSGTNASYSNFLGYHAGYGASNAKDTIFIGSYAGNSDTVNNTTSGTSIAIGRYAGTGGFSNSIAIGHGVTNSAALQANFGNVLYLTGIYNSDTQSATPLSAGNVGIGTSTPGYALTVAGDINFTGALRANGNPGTAGMVLLSNGSSAPTWVATSTLGISGGGGSLLHNYGTRNTFTGSASGNFTLTGTDNTGNGINALGALTSGHSNAALGSNAGNGITSGVRNVAIGYYAIGGGGGSTGNDNVAIGYGVGSATSVTGAGNVGVGVYAIRTLSSGNYNVALGYGAGEAAGTAANNVFVGKAAGSLTTGSNNIMIGYQAGANLVTGTKNIIIGYDISATSSTMTNGLNIGNLIFGTGLDGSATTLSTGKIGIGSTTPYAKLTVAGEAYADLFTAGSTTATSTFAGGLNVGNGALTYNWATGLTNITNASLGAMTFDSDSGMVSWVDMPVTSTSASGTVQSYTAQLDGNPMLSIYGLSDGAGAVNTLRVGVGTTTPVSTFAVAGTINASNLVGGASLSADASGNIILTPSDERLKQDIKPIESALDKLMKLQGVTFDWKDKERFGSSTEIGFIAQDVQKIVPEVIRQGPEYMSLNYSNMVALVVEAVKELKTRVDAVLGWFSPSGDRINIKGMVCVDDVCVTKDQFKQMLMNSGSVMVIPQTSAPAPTTPTVSTTPDTSGSGDSSTSTSDATTSSDVAPVPETTPTTESTPVSEPTPTPTTDSTSTDSPAQ